jgi:hypothetical protein
MAHDDDIRASIPQRVAPESWLPWKREADLARMCIGTGLGSLVKANHMEHGFYNQAFFNLSNGLERLLKLIVLIDFAIENDGSFPSNAVLKQRYGHAIDDLHDAGCEVRRRLEGGGASFRWGPPEAVVTERIIRVLADFAQNHGRYYNLDYLTGATRIGREPIDAWFAEVNTLLAERCPPRTAARFAADAELVGTMLEGHISLVQTTESGVPLHSAADAALHGRMVEWVQQLATFHCATIVRFHIETLWKLESVAHRAGIDVPFLHEFFSMYYNDDALLRRRKTFL